MIQATASAQEHPALAIKRANPGAYDPAVTVPELEQAETICGGDNRKYVNAYTGTAGTSVAFVQNHKAAVGAMAGSTSVGKYCSGTLVSRDLFLTASHCVSAATVGDVVSFNYELSGGLGTSLLAQSFFQVSEIVHDDLSLDFALVRLANAPGSRFGWTALSAYDHPDGSHITIIQHPAGEPKQIDAGSISSHSTTQYRYGSVDTLEGSSGSGILNDSGEIIGVHTHGGCTSGGGENSGTKVSQALLRSSALAAVGGMTPVVLPGDFNGDGRSDLVQATRTWGSLPTCTSTASGSYSCANRGAPIYDWASSEQQFLVGDFNADGRDDVIQTFSRWGTIPTCYSTGSGWSCANHNATIYDWDRSEQTFLVADVDGNGRSDVLQVYRGWGTIPTCKSTGSGYTCSNPNASIYNSGSTEQQFLVGDVDGDGRDDVLQTYRQWGSIPICKSTGSAWSCSNAVATIHDSGSAEQRFLTGDFDGDGRTDVVQTYRGWGSIPRCLSTGSGWSCSNLAATIHNSGSREQRFLVGDFNGDGRDDVAQVYRGWGSIPVCLSTGSGWSCGNWPATIHNSGSDEQSFVVADINGDGRSDIVQTYRKWGSYPTCYSTGSGWSCTNTPATIYNAGP